MCFSGRVVYIALKRTVFLQFVCEWLSVVSVINVFCSKAYSFVHFVHEWLAVVSAICSSKAYSFATLSTKMARYCVCYM